MAPPGMPGGWLLPDPELELEGLLGELELCDPEGLELGELGLWDGLCELGLDEGELGEGMLLGDGMLGLEGGGVLLLDEHPVSASATLVPRMPMALLMAVLMRLPLKDRRVSVARRIALRRRGPLPPILCILT